MKKVLAIMGSPRKGKNTNSALDFFLEGLDQGQFSLDKVYLKDLSIGHCTGCDYCGSTGICIIKDDMQSLYDKIDQSDLVILAAPLYFNSINGLSKNMIDRCQKYWSQKYSLGQSYKRGEDRLGVFISTGGAPYSHNQFDGAIPVMDFFFKAINVQYKGNYFVSGTDNSEVKDRSDVAEELRHLGNKILEGRSFRIHR